MPGLKPPPAPKPNPITAEERAGLMAEGAALIDALPDDPPVEAERAHRVLARLVEAETIGGDEVTEARILVAKFLKAGLSDHARLFRKLADRRSTQIRDIEPAWILGNPASELRQL